MCRKGGIIMLTRCRKLREWATYRLTMRRWGEMCGQFHASIENQNSYNLRIRQFHGSGEKQPFTSWSGCRKHWESTGTHTPMVMCKWSGHFHRNIGHKPHTIWGCGKNSQVDFAKGSRTNHVHTEDAQKWWQDQVDCRPEAWRINHVQPDDAEMSIMVRSTSRNYQEPTTHRLRHSKDIHRGNGKVDSALKHCERTGWGTKGLGRLHGNIENQSPTFWGSTDGEKCQVDLTEASRASHLHPEDGQTRNSQVKHWKKAYRLRIHIGRAIMVRLTSLRHRVRKSNDWG